MNQLLAILTSRTMFLFISTTFSILVVMVLLNIITADDVAKILNLSPEGANALRLIFDRMHEVTANILDILSQLLNKLFGWAGVDVDLSRIKVDVHQTPGTPNTVDPNAAQ